MARRSSLLLSASMSGIVADGNGLNNYTSFPLSIGGGVDMNMWLNGGGVLIQGRSAGSYGFAFQNVGPATTTGTVVLRHTVDSALTFVSVTGAGWTCVVAGRVIECSRSDVRTQYQSFPSITVNVMAPLTTSGVVPVVATLTAPFDTNTSNNTVSDTVNVFAGSDVSVEIPAGPKSGCGASGLLRNSLRNVGGWGTSGGVSLSHTMDSKLTFVSASGLGWTCAFSASTLTCTRAIIPTGATAPLITVNVLPQVDAVGVVNISATATTNFDVALANNSATVSRTVEPGLANCGALAAPLNGSVSTPQGTDEGDTASYVCNAGFALAGSGERTCDAGGAWTGLAPTWHERGRVRVAYGVRD